MGEFDLFCIMHPTRYLGPLSKIDIYFFWKKAQKVSKLYDKYLRNEKKNNGMHKHIFFAICCVIFLYMQIYLMALCDRDFLEPLQQAGHENALKK